MEYKQVKLGDLQVLADEGGVYPGGTNKTTLEDLKAYIGSKKLTPSDPKNAAVYATVAFAFCSYCPTTNARASEDPLLRACGRKGCPYNKQTSSNLQDAPGIVYVLHN